MQLNRSPRMFALALLAMVGCTNEPVRRRIDAGPPTYRLDAGRDAFFLVPDAVDPDADARAWMATLGADCSMGTGNAFGFSGEAGERISGGESWRENSSLGWGATRLSVNGGDAVNIDATSNWFFDFVAPAGATLAPGDYSAAQLATGAEPGQPGLEIHGRGRECTQVRGAFTVHEFEVEDGAIRRFRASFEQDCGYGVLVGCVRYIAP